MEKLTDRKIEKALYHKGLLEKAEEAKKRGKKLDRELQYSTNEFPTKGT